MRRAHDVEPPLGADLVRAEHGAHLVVEDLGGGARQRAQAVIFERKQEFPNRHFQRLGALMHFERRKRMDVNAAHRPFHRTANIDVFGAGVARVNAALHADFRRPARPRLAGALCDLIE